MTEKYVSKCHLGKYRTWQALTPASREGKLNWDACNDCTFTDVCRSLRFITVKHQSPQIFVYILPHKMVEKDPLLHNDTKCHKGVRFQITLYETQ